VTLTDAYIELLKRTLLGQTIGPVTLLQPTPDAHAAEPTGRRARLARALSPPPPSSGIPAEPVEFDLSTNVDGKVSLFHLPPWAMTMIGTRRMDNIEQCVRQALADGVPGDLIETGVWRGGAAIFMRGVLKAREVTDRRVWVADSFQGLPPPDPAVAQDRGSIAHVFEELRVSRQQVEENFRRYDLLDEQVCFLEGWFADTLPEAPIERLAVMRLDGDMYGSTMDALRALYPRLSIGGHVIIDDYGALQECRAAVEDYRRELAIEDPLHSFDAIGRWWQRSR